MGVGLEKEGSDWLDIGGGFGGGVRIWVYLCIICMDLFKDVLKGNEMYYCNYLMLIFGVESK